MTDERFQRDLRAALASRAPHDVPSSLMAHVTTLEQSARTSWRGRLSGVRRRPSGWFEAAAPPVFTALALGLVVVISAVALISLMRAPATLGPGAGGPKAIVWQTAVASLEADSLTIVAGEVPFSGHGSGLQVRSDEGTQTSRTLEVSWRENGVEMRLNVYFEADESHWWVSELRTYDGRPNADWIVYEGPLFRTERGQSYDGPVDQRSSSGRAAGRLVIEGLRLNAFAPGSGPRPFEGCRMIGPTDDDPAQVFDEGQPLARSGILGRSAGEAHELLRGMGICHDFRLEWRYEGASNSGYAQRWCMPPPGEVADAAYGREGQVILFVSDPTPRTPDPNTPQSVGC